MKKMKDNEFLFVLYLFLFALLRVFTLNFSKYSTMILFVATLLVVVISIFHNVLVFKIKAIIFILLMSMILLIDVIFRPNDQIFSSIYQFFIYGAVTVYLYTYVKDKRQVLYYYSFFSLLLFLVYCLDPFFNYPLSTTYMTFGYGSMLIAFSGLHIGRKCFGIKWMVIFEIIAFVELLFFANRGAILSAFVLILMLINFDYDKYSLKKLNRLKPIKKWTLSVIVIIGIYVLSNNAVYILDYLYNLALSFGYYSYSLFQLRNAAYKFNFISIFSGRNAIWESAINFISENMLFGSGVGSFESFYGIYSHNIFLDVLIAYGIVGAIVFFIIVVRAIINIALSKGYERVFGVLILCLSILPLSFSMQYFESKEFWILIMISFESISYNLRIKYKTSLEKID